MKVAGFVVFNRQRIKRATSTKQLPALQAGEAFVKLVLEIPDGLFEGQIVTAVVPARSVVRAMVEPAPETSDEPPLTR